jgi:CubicO group peptidase (beta-lactamase class C family)
VKIVRCGGAALLCAAILIHPESARAAGPAADPSSGDGRLSESKLASELGDFLERLARDDLFSGAVLVARDDRILFQGAWGDANKAFRLRNRIDTRFNLASMNKMFTAVAVGQLAEGGRLSLDDPVGKHLGADWLDPGAARRIRIRHLLSHTSGLGECLDDERYLKASRSGDGSIAHFRTLLASERLHFEPGTEWSYSNIGYLVLGAILETVSGQTYEDYLDLRLFQPAGMTDSGCSPADLPVPGLAAGYLRGEPRGGIAYRSNSLRLDRGGPAGGCYSTVGDLLRFDGALRSGKLLGEAVLEQLWTVTPESRSLVPYGLGFSIVEQPGDTIVGHSGGCPGVSVSFEMRLGTGVTAIVLANYDGAARSVVARLSELLARLEKRRGPRGTVVGE